jgi:hypothetical protein
MLDSSGRVHGGAMDASSFTFFRSFNIRNKLTFSHDNTNSPMTPWAFYNWKPKYNLRKLIENSEIMCWCYVDNPWSGTCNILTKQSILPESIMSRQCLTQGLRVQKLVGNLDWFSLMMKTGKQVQQSITDVILDWFYDEYHVFVVSKSTGNQI